MLGVLSVSGVIGTWAGPRSPGTAFVMAHHKIGDVGDGELGSWGFPEGRHGRAHAGDGLRGEVVRRGDPHRGARGPHPHGERAASTGVALVNGDELDRAARRHHAAPEAGLPPAASTATSCPTDFVGDIERWNTRSGTVKVNLAVDRLPEFTARPAFDPEVHGGTIVLARSLDEVERAFQDAAARPARRAAVRRHLHPVGVRPDARPEGHHIVSMFTQWVPQDWAAKPMHAELEAYADRVVAAVEEVAPGFTSSILHRRVIGPYEMEHEYGLVGGNIFHGELSPNQLFHLRPARRLRRLPHADPRALPGRLGHPRWWRRHRHPGAAGRAPDRARRAPPTCAALRRRPSPAHAGRLDRVRPASGGPSATARRPPVASAPSPPPAPDRPRGLPAKREQLARPASRGQGLDRIAH